MYSIELSNSTASILPMRKAQYPYKEFYLYDKENHHGLVMPIGSGGIKNTMQAGDEYHYLFGEFFDAHRDRYNSEEEWALHEKILIKKENAFSYLGCYGGEDFYRRMQRTTFKNGLGFLLQFDLCDTDDVVSTLKEKFDIDLSIHAIELPLATCSCLYFIPIGNWSDVPIQNYNPSKEYLHLKVEPTEQYMGGGKWKAITGMRLRKLKFNYTKGWHKTKSLACAGRGNTVRKESAWAGDSHYYFHFQKNKPNQRENKKSHIPRDTKHKQVRSGINDSFHEGAL